MAIGIKIHRISVCNKYNLLVFAVLSFYLQLLFVNKVFAQNDLQEFRDTQSQVSQLQEQAAIEEQKNLTESLLTEKEAESVVEQKVTQDPNNLIFPDEQECVVIEKVELNGINDLPKASLRTFVNQIVGQCVGVHGVALLSDYLVNKIHHYGYITTTLDFPEQKIYETKTLIINVKLGQTGSISLSPDSTEYASLKNSFPLRSGQIFDIKAIQRGLDNLQSVSNADVKVVLNYDDQTNITDVVVRRIQNRYLRGGFSFRNTGHWSSGRYIMGGNFIIENPFSISDLLVFSLNQGLKDNYYQMSRNMSVTYRVPFGYWSLGGTIFLSRNKSYRILTNTRNMQTFSNSSQYYITNVKRLLFKNFSHTFSFSADTMVRRTLSRSYLYPRYNQGDSSTMLEIPGSRESFATTTLTTGFQHIYTKPNSNLNISTNVNYVTNRNWFSAKSMFQDGTDRLAGYISISSSLFTPFRMFGQVFGYNLRYNGQFKLQSFADNTLYYLGGGVTRGFSPDSLSIGGTSGWSIQNDFIWYLPRFHNQLYLGVDFGQVGEVINKTTTNVTKASGVTLGTRGRFWNLGYDVYLGMPIEKIYAYEALRGDTRQKTDSYFLGFDFNLSLE